MDEAYREADEDREQLERSLHLASEELLERNRKLERELEERQRLETELGMAEKLRAVGQLASGVAHEINTPIQYIGDSLHFLQDAFKGVLHALQEQERLMLPLVISRPELAGSLRAVSEDADLDYVRVEIPNALARCIDGTQRVAKIVRALKTIAHPDTAVPEWADLNVAIENALVVVANQLKNNANVAVDLRATRCVLCYPGEIQQVLLNLLVNAGDAVQERWENSCDKGSVSVSTEDEGDEFVITIMDDGAGIPEAVQARIFEPFFTTKPVGKGSGQGLPIARSLIVDHHGGRLNFSSVPGKGTTFCIRLPVTGKPGGSEGVRPEGIAVSVGRPTLALG
ncbi:MAG TPA: ATP-binding protein [Polyangiaceae bacterium]|nr:ATP-binding protein [Polyangiaceae bacterium]